MTAGHTGDEVVRLRDVVEADLPILFEHQCDQEGARMAAFTPRDREAFMTHWAGILADRAVVAKAILCGDRVAGNIACYEQSGRRLVGYWIGREFWGRGIASRALAAFVAEVYERPLHAVVAEHNAGSIRVLEKCGFVLEQEHYAEARGPWDAVEERIYVLAN